MWNDLSQSLAILHVTICDGVIAWEVQSDSPGHCQAICRLTSVRECQQVSGALMQPCCVGHSLKNIMYMIVAFSVLFVTRKCIWSC